MIGCISSILAVQTWAAAKDTKNSQTHLIFQFRGTLSDGLLNFRASLLLIENLQSEIMHLGWLQCFRASCVLILHLLKTITTFCSGPLLYYRADLFWIWLGAQVRACADLSVCVSRTWACANVVFARVSCTSTKSWVYPHLLCRCTCAWRTWKTRMFCLFISICLRLSLQHWTNESYFFWASNKLSLWRSKSYCIAAKILWFRCQHTFRVLQKWHHCI